MSNILSVFINFIYIKVKCVFLVILASTNIFACLSHLSNFYLEVNADVAVCSEFVAYATSATTATCVATTGIVGGSLLVEYHS